VAELLEGGLPVTIEPMQEVSFYEGYRQRLETKLDQKIKQIAREELLLKTRGDLDTEALLASLRHAAEERDELLQLLDQVREQIEKFENRD
jgi:hypothetical protein